MESSGWRCGETAKGKAVWADAALKTAILIPSWPEKAVEIPFLWKPMWSCLRKEDINTWLRPRYTGVNVGKANESRWFLWVLKGLYPPGHVVKRSRHRKLFAELSGEQIHHSFAQNKRMKGSFYPYNLTTVAKLVCHEPEARELEFTYVNSYNLRIRFFIMNLTFGVRVGRLWSGKWL